MSLATVYNPENKYTFVCRSFNGHIINKIHEKGHNIILLNYNIEPEINNYDTWIGVDQNTEINQLQNIILRNELRNYYILF